MASTSKCPFCGATLSSEDKVCPSCGAPNERYVADTPRTVFFPKTIAELQEYCAERGMPLLKMRFFIGEDFKEPKAFGIYQDGNDFVVYKNKSNGQRAVRYRGPDEEHAVDEIFTKLLEECHNRGIYPDGKPARGETTRNGGSTRSRGSGAGGGRSGGSNALWIALVCFLGLMALAMIHDFRLHKNDAYYQYNNQYYYHYGSDWYTSDSGYDDWYEVYDFPVEDYEDYYVGEDFDSDWGVSDFKSSDTYEELREDNSSSSSDYDSWDSSDTDWDSDW